MSALLARSIAIDAAWMSGALATASRTSVGRATSTKPILVPMKVLQRLLRILPAVVPAAVVEVDEPDALDVDAKAHHRLGPVLHDALLVALRVLGKGVDPVDGLLRQALNVRQQR